jgi:hypothetical protein
MQIEITNRFTSDGKEFFEWDLWDGPADCSDHAHGYATDLITAFSKLIEWKERIDRDYVAEFESDLNTLQNFITDNETDDGTAN